MKGAVSGKRLTAQPVSKDTAFDMKDLEELVPSAPTSPWGSCSKAHAIFAMRACRKV
ncbi:hypothetical protein FB451DRAFT_594762 [Mycena latifolia]|nr:hypothetical protein FB451DRAFT_594762 [Mycena latifolia]